ncbi:hypothetical protein [uncultured Bartonella sp.]|uniref:hypothetical protein n=1 Tax=uncultured Bartonella sp. TaxID=104108 RepID=UPI0025CDDC43|nr:hypothetical protein [uncultured Bartonella sp.]
MDEDHFPIPVERGFTDNEFPKPKVYESLFNLRISLQSLSYLDNAPQKCVPDEGVMKLT